MKYPPSMNVLFAPLLCLVVMNVHCSAQTQSVQMQPPQMQPAQTKPVRVTTTPISREPQAFTRQNLVLGRAQNETAEVVFIGDSITEGWEGAPEQWRAMVTSHTAINLGVGGDRTQHVLWRLEQAPLSKVNPKVVVVMIGTNNTYDDSGEDIVAGIRAVVQIITKQCPNAEVILLDIPPRGENMNPLRGKITQVNQALSRGGLPAHARFVSVGDQFVRPDGALDQESLPDALHFSATGYAKWAASIKPELECSLAANHSKDQSKPVTAH